MRLELLLRRVGGVAPLAERRESVFALLIELGDLAQGEPDVTERRKGTPCADLLVGRPGLGGSLVPGEGVVPDRGELGVAIAEVLGGIEQVFEIVEEPLQRGPVAVASGTFDRLGGELDLLGLFADLLGLVRDLLIALDQAENPVDEVVRPGRSPESGSRAPAGRRAGERWSRG